MQRLIDWANARDGWVRALVAAAIATRRELPKSAVDAAYAQLLVEKGLEPGEVREVAPLAASGAAEDGDAALRLDKLSNVSGVNALAEGQQLAFHPQLTVLYGENASGKTGYARILKCLAGARSAEEILPDVHQPAAAAPHATLEYDGGAKLEWRGERGVAPFTRMSVFDARAVALHVDDDLTYVFTPADLALYRFVHQGIEQVRAKLDAQLAAAGARGNPFLAHFKRDALVFPLVEALGADTDVDALEKLAALGAEDARRLDTLREQVAALKPESSRGRLGAAAGDADFYAELQDAAGALRTFDFKGLAAAAARLKSAEGAREKVADDAFAKDEIPGSHLPEWRAFIEAAEAYLAAVGEKRYPDRGDACVYCQQPLKPGAATLIKRYRKHVHDAPQSELQKAQADHAHRADELAQLPVAALRKAVKSRLKSLEGHSEPPPLVLTRAARLLELDDVKAAAEVEELAGEEHQRATALIASLKQQASERQQALDAAQAELWQLENRFALNVQLKELEAFVTRAKWAAQAAAVSSKLSGLLRSLTEQSKAANEEALNQDFERLFVAECEQLKAPAVKLDFSGRKGQAARKKLSATRRPSEVLSEGEQGVIALADFLAEVSLRKGAAPVVFDDPVNGLDGKRVQYVADRLATLSRSRQVIVFTHSEAFAEALRARGAGAMLRVLSRGGRPGLIEGA